MINVVVRGDTHRLPFFFKGTDCETSDEILYSVCSVVFEAAYLGVTEH